MDAFSLTGKTAVVTGAAGLLGRQHCVALANAGANVVVADLDIAAATRVASELASPALAVELDVVKPESVARAKDLVIGRFGSVEVLVNNAAINDMVERPEFGPEQSAFENFPLDAWERSFAVNVTGVFVCCREFGSVMAANGGGSIINIASTYGIVGPDQSLYRDEAGQQLFYKGPAYPACKGAIVNFTRYLAAYWGHRQIRVNALSPGGVDNHQAEYFREEYSRRTLLGRMASPTDYHGAVVFLASDASAYMTGANLVVDGGWTAI